MCLFAYVNNKRENYLIFTANERFACIANINIRRYSIVIYNGIYTQLVTINVKAFCIAVMEAYGARRLLHIP